MNGEPIARIVVRSRPPGTPAAEPVTGYFLRLLMPRETSWFCAGIFNLRPEEWQTVRPFCEAHGIEVLDEPDPVPPEAA